MSNIPRLIAGEESQLRDYILRILPAGAGMFSMEDMPMIVQKLSTQQDLFYLTPLEGKKTIAVEQISDLITFASKKPILGQTATVLIYPAQKLGLESQNKLLKILEEPPMYLQIYLFADKASNLLATIRSRCQIETFNAEPSVAPELSQYVGGLINKQTRLDTYIKVDEEMAKLTPAARTEFLAHIIINLYQSINDKYSNDPTRVEVFHLLLSKLHRGLKANVNSKLLLDRLFLGLESIS